jgi:hypothetical protein
VKGERAEIGDKSPFIIKMEEGAKLSHRIIDHITKLLIDKRMVSIGQLGEREK